MLAGLGTPVPTKTLDAHGLVIHPPNSVFHFAKVTGISSLQHTPQKRIP